MLHGIIISVSLSLVFFVLFHVHGFVSLKGMIFSLFVIHISIVFPIMRLLIIWPRPWSIFVFLMIFLCAFIFNFSFTISRSRRVTIVTFIVRVRGLWFIRRRWITFRWIWYLLMFFFFNGRLGISRFNWYIFLEILRGRDLVGLFINFWLCFLLFSVTLYIFAVLFLNIALEFILFL